MINSTEPGLESIAQGLKQNYAIKILKLSNIGITKIKELSKILSKKMAIIELDLSGNPFLGKEFIDKLIRIIQSEYPIENLRLANNNWSKDDTTKLINAMIANKEKKVNIDLSGNEISLNSQTALNNYRAAINLQILDEDLQNPIIETCLPGTKGKRSISECKIGWSNVDEISISKTRNREEIIIDSKKFLAYSRQYITDEQKSWQLIRLAQEIQNKGGQKILGEYKGLFDMVIEAGGYKNYIQQERIKEVGLFVINRDEHNISPELKLKLINAAGKVQLIRGIHSTIVSCQDESTNSCALSVSGLGYSFLSQPIENIMVKVVPKMVGNAVDVTSKLAPKILSYDTKFILQTFGIKYGAKIAKGGAGAIASIFDIVDIGMASNILIECNKRADSNPCSDKEIRDNIASITFSSISFISSVGLTAVGAGPAAVVVGAIIMVGQGVYNGISNIIEYEKKYDTTFSENMEIFFRSLVFMSPPRSVEHLAARTRYVNDTVLSAWEELNKLPDNIVAYAIGLGEVEFRDMQKSRKMILASPVFCPSDVKNCSPDIIYYQDTVYSPSRITVPTFSPAYAMINMSREDSAMHVRGDFSRVLPNPIKDSNMICLPKVSEQAYELHKQSNAVLNILMCLNIPLCITSQVLKSEEYNQAQSADEYIQMSRYDCNNAVVLEHVSRMNLGFKNKSIVYNLANVNKGEIFGSKKLNNIFLVFEGDTQIFGGAGSNEFIMFRDKYNGSIYLDNNSINNIIDVSKLSSDIISMEYYNKDMNITIDKETFRINKSENTKIKYIGRKNKVDKIICRNSLWSDVIIDSGGGENYVKTDKIQNCTKLIMSPNTVVQGASGNYTIYVKSLDYATNYNTSYATSEIDIAGRGTIVFPEISLLKDTIEIKRLPNNSLSIIMPLGHNAQYELVLRNYLNENKNPNYALIDKYGNNIFILDGENTAIKKIVLYLECNFDTVADVVKHYRNIKYSKEDYAVFSTVKNTQYNNFLKFGSSKRDIIIINKDVVYVEGSDGSDLYIIDNNIDYPVNVNNKAADLQLDVLKLPVNNINDLFLIEDTNNLHLLFNKRDEVEDTKYQGIPQEVIIDNLNDSTSFSRIEYNINQFVNNNKQEVQQIIIKLAGIVDIAQNSHHKHRHHHGESINGAEHHVDNKHIRGYHRVRRDIEEELQIAKDRNDNNDVIGVSVGDDAVISSSSGTLFKPIGYNIIKWIKNNIWASINLNPIERIKNLLNIDDVKEKVEIHDVDVSDNVGYGNNDNGQDDLVKKLSIIRSIEAQIVELEERKVVEKKLLSKLNQKLKIIEEECRNRSDEQEEYEEELSSRLLTLTKRKVDIQKQYAAADQIVIIEEINNEIARIKQSIEENEQLNSNYFGGIEILKAKVLRGDITELYYEDRMKDLEQKIKDCEEEDIRLANLLEELEKQQEEYYKLGPILGERFLRKIEALNIEEKKILQEEEELVNIHSNIQDQAQEVYRLKEQIKLQETKIESLKNSLNALNDNLATLDTRDSNLSWHEELSYWNETVDAKNDTADQVSSCVNSSINLSSRLIGNEESTIINGINDHLLDKGNLLLLDLLIRKKNGVKYNSQKAMIDSREVDTKYAQSLAYNAYTPRAENEEDMELLGAS